MMVMMEYHLPSSFGRAAEPLQLQHQLYHHPLSSSTLSQHRSGKKSFTIDSILQPELAYNQRHRTSYSELQDSANRSYGLNQFCHFNTAALTRLPSQESGLTLCKTAQESMNFVKVDCKPDTVVPVPVPVYLRHGKTTFSSLKSKKCRRSRTVFTEAQLKGLENIFEQQKYLSTSDRLELADRLGLSQLQIKTWYQNRRMKWKKQVLESGETESPTKPKGRPKKSEPVLLQESNTSYINTN